MRPLFTFSGDRSLFGRMLFVYVFGLDGVLCSELLGAAQVNQATLEAVTTASG